MSPPHLATTCLTHGCTQGWQPDILVVNDTQETLNLLQDLLEDEGFRVTTSLSLL